MSTSSHCVAAGAGVGFFEPRSAPSDTSTVKTDLTSQAPIRTLIQHILQGNEKKAQEMLEDSPKLLLQSSRERDYSGRLISGTPFRVALGAGDRRMWEMMEPYFDVLEQNNEIESAHEEKREQFNDQFPDGVFTTPAKTQQEYYNSLVAEFSKDPTRALGRFKEKFREKSVVVETGRHFNLNELVAAYMTYLRNFEILKDYKKQRGSYLFFAQVIGFLQRQLPTIDAQVLCSSMNKVLENPTQFERTLKTDDDLDLFPLNKASILDPKVASWKIPVDTSRRLGHELGYFASNYGATSKMWLNRYELKEQLSIWQRYAEQVHQQLREVCARLQGPPPSCSSVRRMIPCR